MERCWIREESLKSLAESRFMNLNPPCVITDDGIQRGLSYVEARARQIESREEPSVEQQTLS